MQSPLLVFCYFIVMHYNYVPYYFNHIICLITLHNAIKPYFVINTNILFLEMIFQTASFIYITRSVSVVNFLRDLHNLFSVSSENMEFDSSFNLISFKLYFLHYQGLNTFYNVLFFGLYTREQTMEKRLFCQCSNLDDQFRSLQI